MYKLRRSTVLSHDISLGAGRVCTSQRLHGKARNLQQTAAAPTRGTWIESSLAACFSGGGFDSDSRPPGLFPRAPTLTLKILLPAAIDGHTLTSTLKVRSCTYGGMCCVSSGISPHASAMPRWSEPCDARSKGRPWLNFVLVGHLSSPEETVQMIQSTFCFVRQINRTLTPMLSYNQ